MSHSARPARAPWLLLALSSLIPLVFATAATTGELRALLAVVLAAVVACLHPRLGRPVILDGEAERAVVTALRVACVGLFVLHLGAGARALRGGEPLAGDAWATQFAAQRLLEAERPYAEAAPLAPAKPASVKPSHRSEAQVERGYPDGPLGVLAAAPALYVAGETGVRALNVAFYLAFLAAAFLLFGELGVTAAGRWAAAAALLLDVNTAWRSMADGSGDVRALALLALALLALARRRTLLFGVGLGLALAMKPIPAVAFLPLLVAARSTRAAVACAAAVAAAYLPFAIWDPAALSAPIAGVFQSTLPGILRMPLCAVAVWLAWRVAAARTGALHRELALCVLALVAGLGLLTPATLSWIPWLSAAAAARAWWAPAAPASSPSRSRAKAARR